MRDVLSQGNLTSALVEPNGCERAAEPPCVAQGALCGDCAAFSVLDELPQDTGKWFGVCLKAARRDLTDEAGWGAALDWAYANGRHCRDAACDEYEEE